LFLDQSLSFLWRFFLILFKNGTSLTKIDQYCEKRHNGRKKCNKKEKKRTEWAKLPRDANSFFNSVTTFFCLVSFSESTTSADWESENQPRVLKMENKSNEQTNKRTGGEARSTKRIYLEESIRLPVSSHTDFMNTCKR
jgi:hypothetical protein